MSQMRILKHEFVLALRCQRDAICMSLVWLASTYRSQVPVDTVTSRLASTASSPSLSCVCTESVDIDIKKALYQIWKGSAFQA